MACGDDRSIKAFARTHALQVRAEHIFDVLNTAWKTFQVRFSATLFGDDEPWLSCAWLCVRVRVRVCVASVCICVCVCVLDAEWCFGRRAPVDVCLT